MKRQCMFCTEPLIDGEILTAVVKVKYKEIPSKVHYALSPMTECLGVAHEDCMEMSLDFMKGYD